VRVNLINEDRVIVEGVNIVIKHVRRGRARQAGRVEVEAPLYTAKVMLVCPSCGQPTRVGVRSGADGKNVRYCKKCDQLIPRPTVD
jgi:large subunit ribosomal protein L24